MKKLLILILAVAVVGGCKSAVRRQVEDTKMVRVHLEPAHTTEEIRNEITQLIDNLRIASEIVSKDDLEGMLGKTIDRLVAIGQPTVAPLIDSYYDALENYDEVHFRYLILAVLHRLQDHSSQKFLVQVLKRGDKKERRMAAEALWRFGDTSCVGALIVALNDDSIDVVNASAAGLRAITGFNFGIYRSVSDSQRQEAVTHWRRWWEMTGSALPPGRVGSF